jgi:hypothetical protein
VEDLGRHRRPVPDLVARGPHADVRGEQRFPVDGLAASYTVDGNSFQAEKPRVWGEGKTTRLNGSRGFDLHPDSTRVVIGAVRDSNGNTETEKAIFVFNFFDELRPIAPTVK